LKKRSALLYILLLLCLTAGMVCGLKIRHSVRQSRQYAVENAVFAEEKTPSANREGGGVCLVSDRPWRPEETILESGENSSGLAASAAASQRAAPHGGCAEPSELTISGALGMERRQRGGRCLTCLLLWAVTLPAVMAALLLTAMKIRSTQKPL